MVLLLYIFNKSFGFFEGFSKFWVFFGETRARAYTGFCRFLKRARACRFINVFRESARSRAGFWGLGRKCARLYRFFVFEKMRARVKVFGGLLSARAGF